MPAPVLDFIERIERGVERWQAEGLSSPQALNQAWASELLALEADGTLPKGYLRCRVGEHVERDRRRGKDTHADA